MLYAETLLIYPYWKIPFMVHTNVSGKQFIGVISQNNKPIKFFSMIISKPKRNYTRTK